MGGFGLHLALALGWGWLSEAPILDKATVLTLGYSAGSKALARSLRAVWITKNDTT